MMKKLLFTFAAGAILATGSLAQTNLNLENWTGNECDEWGTLNSFSFLGAPQTVFQEQTIPGEGLSSAKITTGYWAGATNFGASSDTVSGFLTLGGPITGPIGIPFTVTPSSMSFMYKADLEPGDTGVVLVQLSYWDALLDSQMIFAQGIQLIGDSGDWQTATITIYDFSGGMATPDTLQILCASSMGSLFGLPMPIIGSTIYVDGFFGNSILASFNYTDAGNGEVNFSDLSLTSPTSWSWDFGDGNTSTAQNPTNTYAATTDTTYNVCLTATNSSGNDTYCDSVFVVAPILGMGEMDENIAFSIYPNPTSGNVVIKNGSSKSDMDVEMIDINGKFVRSYMDVPGGEMTIDGNGLARGTYFIKVTSGGKQVVKQVIFE